jgi:hypothetical protein
MTEGSGQDASKTADADWNWRSLLKRFSEFATGLYSLRQDVASLKEDKFRLVKKVEELQGEVKQLTGQVAVMVGFIAKASEREIRNVTRDETRAEFKRMLEDMLEGRENERQTNAPKTKRLPKKPPS